MSTAHSDITIAENPDDESPAQGDSGSVMDGKPASPAPQEKEAIKEEPFSIYTKREKWIIVALISMGATFSPLRYVARADLCALGRLIVMRPAPTCTYPQSQLLRTRLANR